MNAPAARTEAAARRPFAGAGGNAQGATAYVSLEPAATSAARRPVPTRGSRPAWPAWWRR